MFEEFIAQKLKEAAVTWAAQKNALIESEYLGLAQQWAQAKVRGSTAAAPSIPFAIQFDFIEGGLVASITSTPISAIQPGSFLPTYGTDTNGINDLIGGPIPGQPGKFYATASSSPQPGNIVSQSGSTYVYQRPSPFGGYWIKL